MASKPSREEVEKLIGKRTPLPSGKGAGALNDLDRARKPPPKPESMGNLADPVGLKKNLRDRSEKQALKCGGKVMKKGKK